MQVVVANQVQKNVRAKNIKGKKKHVEMDREENSRIVWDFLFS